jgi:putative phage-type endonuclease
LNAPHTPNIAEAHKTGIGGSEVATILGINPFCTPFQLFLEKTGRLPAFEGNEHTRAGKVMEQVIGVMYAERAGVKLRRINRTLRHPKFPWLIAHIDRDVVGEPKGVEIKNCSPRVAHYWGKDGDPDGVAEYYIPQPHHYMLMLDYPVFDVAAYFGGSDLRVYPLERDREMDDIIVAATHDFWHENILKDVPPEPSWEHRTTSAVLSQLYPGTSGETVEADEAILAWAKVAREAAAKAAEYESVASTAKAHMLHFMGEAAVLKLDGNSVFRRKAVTRKGYTVADSSYIDARFTSTKPAKEA